MITNADLLAYYASGGPFGSAKLSTYRYLSTNILTGQRIGDWLPLEVQSFSAVINGGGTLTASLDAIPDPVQNLQNLAAINPRKAILWALQDGVPVWNGQINAWNPTTVLQQQLPVQASTLEQLLAGRFITTDLVFTDADIFDMARGIVQYAFSMTPNGQVAGITYSSGECGITDSLTFEGSQNGDCLSALQTLVSTYGIEFNFRPCLTQAGQLQTSFDLGYPSLGQGYPASGLAYNFPGNLLDYAFGATAGANEIIGSAQSSDGSGTAYEGSAIDSVDIANGYPLQQSVVSPTGVTFSSSEQVAAYCQGILPSMTATQVAPLLVLGNGQQPQLNVTQLGSYAAVAFTSWMHPATSSGGPGWTSAGRVASWECYPPSDQQAEYLQVQLGAMPFEGSTL